MIIDSHQHFWKYDVARHFWMDDTMATLRRNFLPDDLRPIYANNGIEGCVAVQVDQTLGETAFLLELAGQHDFIKGVVGWIDFRSEGIEADLERYKSDSYLKGWRHIVQEEQDHNFLMRPDFLRGIGHLGKYGHTYDILVFPHQLGAVLEFVKQFPEQPFVIDHIAKPYIKDGFFEGWAVLMREIATHENVHCKLSGMITEADFKTWTPNQLLPYMEFTLECFGAERIMFGSDWPVCLVAGSYEQVLGVVTEFIATLSPAEQQAIMGGNAMAFYKL